ncbi:NINE protein [Leptospira interrogans]|uniref:TM2 domain-containing protein n=1 Tax=Leptospira interrogans TaxID=173 RepID=UPI001F078289|nr:NINE protein [Leptospira interrogans]UML84105.1 NINE protein [Leptospira interrogans]
MKSKGLAYLLWFFGCFGILGIHRFYLGKIGTGILWLSTLGVCGFGAFFDLFTLGSQVDAENAKIELKEIKTATLANIVSNK